MEDAAREEQHVTCIVVRVELERSLKVGLGGGQGLQLFVGKAPKEVGPDKIRLLGQTGVQAGQRCLPALHLQVTNRKEKLGPEMGGL